MSRRNLLQSKKSPHNLKKQSKLKLTFSRVALDPRILDMTICIGAETSLEAQAEILQFLNKNNDVLLGTPLT
jgi:hypothetical protein